jgi:hypothetical protein
MSLVLGLDIGTKSLTGAIFARSGKKCRLVDFFVEEIPVIGSDAPAGGEYVAPLSLEELLGKTLREKNLTALEVVAGVDGKDCIIREIYVPFTRDDQIRKTVHFEAEGHFTAFDLDDAVLEYIKVGEVEGKSRLVLVALRNGVVEKRLGLLKGASIDPVALDLDAAALFNAFAQTPTFDPARSTLLVDMGATSTKILLIEKGELKKIRAVRLETYAVLAEKLIAEPAAVGGGPEVAIQTVGEGAPPPGFGDFSIEARFKEIENALRRLDPIGLEDGGPDGPDGGAPIAILSDEEFDLVRSGNGGDLGAEGPALAAADSVGEPPFRGRFPQARAENGFVYRDYLERLGIEIHRSLATAELSAPIELICLTGGMSGREEARRFFTEEFDVETIRLDFGASGDSFESDLEPEKLAQVGQVGAVAVGLAMKQLQRDRVGLDFRKGRFRYEHRFERLKFPLLIAASLFFLFFLQATFWTSRTWKEENQRLASYELYSRESVKEFFGKPLADKILVPGRHPLMAAREQEKAWKGKGTGEVSRFLDATTVLRNFGQMISESRVRFELRTLDLRLRLKQGPARQGQRPALVADRSTGVLWTDDSGAREALLMQFRKPSSEFFDINASASRSGDGWNLSFDLTVKERKLREIQQQE